MEAHHCGQRQLEQAVQPPDMGPLVGQDAGQGLLVFEIHCLGKENHRAEKPVGQRGGDLVRDPDLHLPPELEPGFQARAVRREGLPEAPPPADIANQEPRRQQQAHRQPQGCPNREGRGGGHSGGLRGNRNHRGGRRDRRSRRDHWRGQSVRDGGNRLGAQSLQQGVDAEPGSQLHRQQQPGRRQPPEGHKGTLGKTPEGQPPESRDGQDEDPAGER